jgi:hypothetical protein
LKEACTLDTQLKRVTTRVEQQAQELRDETHSLREDFNKEMQVTRKDIEATRCGLETTRRDFETQLAAVEARTRCTVPGKVGTSAGQLNPSKFDGTTSWAVCQRQFKVEADHDWIPREKAVQLLSVLKRQDADVLVSLPKLRTRKSSGLLTAVMDRLLTAATQGQIPDEQ